VLLLLAVMVMVMVGSRQHRILALAWRQRQEKSRRRRLLLLLVVGWWLRSAEGRQLRERNEALYCRLALACLGPIRRRLLVAFIAQLGQRLREVPMQCLHCANEWAMCGWWWDLGCKRR
jgi:hypothetical protein